MIKKLITCVFIVLFAGLAGRTQEFRVCGTILDAVSKQPIAFSTVELQALKTGTIADSAGYFCLSLASGPERVELLFKALGYADTLIQVETGAGKEPPGTFFLQPKSYLLKEVTVVPSADGFRAGVFKESTYSGYTMSNWMQVAVQMKNPRAQKGLVKSVGFFIGKSPASKAPFRVRLYRVGADGRPGEDLLVQSLVVAAKKNEQWFSVDLSGYKIEFPPEGVFVAMEWIYSGDRYYYKTKIADQEMKLYGQELGNVMATGSESLTWIYRLGNSWEPDDRALTRNGETFRRNALIVCEVRDIE